MSLNTREIPTKYERIKNLSSGRFQRLTGVKPAVFAKMLTILKRAERKKRKSGGKEPKLILEDRLLMTLEYLREYRTYFHLADSYHVSESTAYKTCRWVEDTLIQDKRLALPGKKALLKSAMEYEVILVDATESPVERPKKDKGPTTPAKRNGTPSKPNSSFTRPPSESSV